MESKIGVLTTGMIIGMFILVACEPLYQKLTEAKDGCIKKISKVTNDAKTSFENVKAKVEQKTDDALDTIDDKLNDLILSLDKIDISKVKGKSKMFLENIREKLSTLKE